jgi:hypothetical protein
MFEVSLGLLVSFVKSRRFNETIYGKLVVVVFGGFCYRFTTIFPDWSEMVSDEEGHLSG